MGEAKNIILHLFKFTPLKKLNTKKCATHSTMHAGPVDLRPELHTPECNELVKALLKCYDENRFGKIFGACDKHNVAMEKCFHREQEERRLNNTKRTRKKDANSEA